MRKNLVASVVTSAIVSFNDSSDEDITIQINDLAIDMPSERTFKDSGAMIAPCTIARTGIMQYRASDCGAMFKDRDPNSIVKIATLEADLFDEKSIESYRSAPITINHPSGFVNTENAKDLQKGNLDSIPFADGNLLSGHIVITDADTLKLIDEGTSQLSSGHTCTLILADEDAEYDAYKTNIRANHIAIVDSGRAGVAQIADEDIKLTDAEIKLKDVELKLTEAEAKLVDSQATIDKLNAEVDAGKDKLTEVETKLKDAETKLTDASIDKLVSNRLTFVQEVATLSDKDITGMSTIEAKRAVVTELRDKDLSSKSDTYIECAFELALEDVDSESPMTNLLRQQVEVEVKDTVEVPTSKAQIARNKMIKRNQGTK